MKNSVFNSPPLHQQSTSVVPCCTSVPKLHGDWPAKAAAARCLSPADGPALGGDGHGEPSEEARHGMAELESINVGARMPSKAQCYHRYRKRDSSPS